MCLSEILLTPGILHWDPRSMLLSPHWYFLYCMCSVGLLSCIRNLEKSIFGGSELPHLGFTSFCTGLRMLLLKSKQLFLLASLLHYIPTLLLFRCAEEPGLEHKIHHIHGTGWRGLVFAFIKQSVIILRNLSFAEAEILLELDWLNFNILCEIVKSFFLFLLMQ